MLDNDYDMVAPHKEAGMLNERFGASVLAINEAADPVMGKALGDVSLVMLGQIFRLPVLKSVQPQFNLLQKP